MHSVPKRYDFWKHYIFINVLSYLKSCLLFYWQVAIGATRKHTQ